MGQVDKARRYLCRSLAITREIGFARDIVNLCYEFARVFVLENDYDRAVEMLSVVMEHPASTQERLFEGRICDSAKELLNTLEDKLEAGKYKAAIERGRSLDLEVLVNKILTQAD